MRNWIKAAFFSLAVASCGAPAYAETSESMAAKVMPSVGELYSKVISERWDDDFVCSVSKIGPSKFLTAGHCLSGQGFYTYSVKYGDDKVSVSHVSIGMKGKGKWTDVKDFRGNTSMEWQTVKEDWAILYTEKDVKAPVLKLGCTDNIRPGTAVVTAGFPWPAGKSYFEGYVSSVAPLKINSGGSFFADIQAAAGASGSPVISRDSGDIVGILITVLIPGNRHLTTGVQSVQTQGLCGVAVD